MHVLYEYSAYYFLSCLFSLLFCYQTIHIWNIQMIRYIFIYLENKANILTTIWLSLVVRVLSDKFLYIHFLKYNPKNVDL